MLYLKEISFTIKKILLTDPYMSYLVDAIKHVTSTHDE